MKTLTETYRNAPLEIRFRAPIFHAILVLLSILSIVIIVNDLASNEKLVTILEHSFLVLITILAWLLLRMGHYRRVANFYFSFITIIFLLLRFSRAYTGLNALPLFALIPGSFMVFGAVFIPDRRFIYGLSGIYIASYAAFAAYLAASGSVPETDVSVLQQSVYPAIGVLAIAFGLVTIRILFDRVLASTLENLNEVRRMSEKARLIASDSAGQLAKADLLLRDSQETANAAVEIEENMRHISDRIVDLDTRIDHAGKTIADVKETAVALNDLSRNQAVQVNQSGASIEEMVASIRNVSRIIEERTAGVRLLTDKAATGQKIVRATVTSFGKVSSHMDAIRDMASVIGDIADRTNLLAMNASIQAAHAGEAGRGFAVVAGEIRALAESSSNSASAIAETLSELASSVDETGGTVDSAGKAFGDIVLEIEEFAEAIGEIAGNAKELEAGSREILDATAELNRITRSVDDQARHVMESQESFAEDVSMVGNISNEITLGTGEIATGISLINKSVGGIHALAVELQERSMALNRALNDEKDS